MIEQAKVLTKGVNGICVAIVHNGFGNYALAEEYLCKKSLQKKFLLFNAEETKCYNAQLLAVTYNTSISAFTRYRYNFWIKFQPESIF